MSDQGDDEPRYTLKEILERINEDPDFLETVGGFLSALGAKGVQELGALFLELDSGTDRACAIVSCAFIDDALNKLLLSKMVRLSSRVEKRVFSGNGALGSVSAKIDIAFGFRCIDEETFQDLHLIRQIRNRFAHDFSVDTFEHSKVAQYCQSFSDAAFEGKFPRPKKNRSVFNQVSVFSIGFLHGIRIGDEPAKTS